MDVAKACKQFDMRFRVKPRSRVHLSKIDPDERLGIDDVAAADAKQDANVERIAKLQQVLYADNRFSLLIILQGMDTSGKDGTIRHLLSGVNPAGVHVVSFKAPTSEELEHDYLWRVHNACPRRGEIGVFNRSHYEDVLIVRVHDLVPKAVWSQRYEQINAFEQHLRQNNTIILKFFLHISKAEQKERLQARLSDPEKHWKMNPRDLDERKHWNQYQAAYADALSKCSRREAPWYIIPANRKWFRNLAISQIVADSLESLKLRYPKPDFDPRALRID